MTIVEYEGDHPPLTRRRALDGALLADLDDEDDRAEVAHAARLSSSAERDALRPPSGRAPSVDRALDEALVHAPRRAGASHAEVIGAIQERTGVDEEAAWAILGRALARVHEPKREQIVFE